MQTEIEVKFLHTDHDQVRAKLTTLGASCKKPDRLMKRVIIDNDYLNAKDAFVRIRDEGEGITLTYKQFSNLSIDGAKEIEMTIDSFEKAVAFFDAINMPKRSVQESRRETWLLGDVEIMLDEWPWLKPYIEIEGPSERGVREVASMLGFDWQQAVFGDVMAAYRAQYPHLTEKDTVGNIAEVRFGDPLPELLAQK